jgi:hypothetical protein
MSVRNPSAISPDQVQDAVVSIKRSVAFANSPRLQRFLTYVVKETLEGRRAQLKEYSIALAVFERDPSFNPQTDTIVRVEARRLRQQLANYYVDAGRSDPLRITIPKGGYAPEFQFNHELVPESAHKPSGRWFRIAAFSLMLGVGALLGFRFFSPSRVPHRFQLTESALRIVAENGSLCWEKPLPRMDWRHTNQVRDKVHIGDIDGDGQVEVLFNSLPESDGKRGGSLQCFEADGRLRWEFSYGARKTFGARTFEAQFFGIIVRPVYVDGKPAVLTLANHMMWYPAQAALIDASSGRPFNEYWHPGAFYYADTVDLDADGRDELLIAAINNPGDGLGHAALVALKLPFGSPPVEHAYSLFPTADVSEALGVLPIITQMTVESPNRILVVVPLPEKGALTYYLDRTLNVTEFRASDNFASLHERLYRLRLLDHALAAAERSALGRAVSFPTAPNGNDPELKRHWRFK